MDNQNNSNPTESATNQLRSLAVELGKAKQSISEPKPDNESSLPKPAEAGAAPIDEDQGVLSDETPAAPQIDKSETVGQSASQERTGEEADESIIPPIDPRFHVLDPSDLPEEPELPELPRVRTEDSASDAAPIPPHESPEPRPEIIQDEGRKAFGKIRESAAYEIRISLRSLGYRISDEVNDQINSFVDAEYKRLFEQRANDQAARSEESHRRGRIINWGRRNWPKLVAGAAITGLGTAAYLNRDKISDFVHRSQTAVKTEAQKSEKAKSEAQKSAEIKSQKLQIDRKSGSDCVWDAIKLQIVPGIIKGDGWHQGMISQADLVTDAIKDDWVDWCHANGKNPDLVHNGDVITIGKFLKPETQAEIDRINNTKSLSDYLDPVDQTATQTRTEKVQGKIVADAAKHGIKVTFPERPAQAPELTVRSGSSAEAYTVNQQAAQATKPVEQATPSVEQITPSDEQIAPSDEQVSQPILTQAPAVLPELVYQPAEPSSHGPQISETINRTPATSAEAYEVQNQTLNTPNTLPTESTLESPNAAPIIPDQEEPLPAPDAKPLEEAKFVTPQTLNAPDASPDYGSWGYGETKKKKKPGEL